MKFERAEKVADAVLYEGYLLYPYRASAMKNQVRWQFGVVMPRDYSEGGGSEPWTMQTECLVEPGDAPVLDLRLRFLQVQARIVEKTVNAEQGIYWPVESFEVDGRQLVSWDEGVKHELDHLGINITELVAAERAFPVEIAAGREVELIRDTDGEIKARIIRDRLPITGVIRVAGERDGQPDQDSHPDRKLEPVATRRESEAHSSPASRPRRSPYAAGCARWSICISPRSAGVGTASCCLVREPPHLAGSSRRGRRARRYAVIADYSL